MPKLQKRYKLKLNSTESIEELLQETYIEACKNIEEIQQQINRLSSSTQLNDESLEAKTKYAKAINDFIVNKDKAIGRKLEISKLMSEILKYNGNVDNAINSTDVMESISIEELKKALVEEETNMNTNVVREYDIR